MTDFLKHVGNLNLCMRTCAGDVIINECTVCNSIHRYRAYDSMSQLKRYIQYKTACQSFSNNILTSSSLAQSSSPSFLACAVFYVTQCICWCMRDALHTVFHCNSVGTPLSNSLGCFLNALLGSFHLERTLKCSDAVICQLYTRPPHASLSPTLQWMKTPAVCSATTLSMTG